MLIIFLIIVYLAIGQAILYLVGLYTDFDKKVGIQFGDMGYKTARIFLAVSWLFIVPFVLFVVED